MHHHGLAWHVLRRRYPWLLDWVHEFQLDADLRQELRATAWEAESLELDAHHTDLLVQRRLYRFCTSHGWRKGKGESRMRWRELPGLSPEAWPESDPVDPEDVAWKLEGVVPDDVLAIGVKRAGGERLSATERRRLRQFQSEEEEVCPV